MLHRNLLHMVRYPGLSVFTIMGPVVFLLLFVSVYGGTPGARTPDIGPEFVQGQGRVLIS